MVLFLELSSKILPAYFGHYEGAKTNDIFDKEITDIKELTKKFEETILWKIGETLYDSNHNFEKYFIQKARNAVYGGNWNINRTMNSYDDMNIVFAGYQIVLSQSIHPKRIIKVVSSRNEYGKILHKNRKHKEIKDND